MAIIYDVNESVSDLLQNMPKVYFCCHPDEFDEYYPKVKQELFEIFPNISFWYYDKKDEPDEGEINKMNLMVIVVTNKFLDKYRSEKHSCYKAIDLAKEKHIPMLPLLQEGVPDVAYAAVFGHSQYLSKINNGSFAISYEEKLKKRLRETLLNDADRKQIEDAFLAMVFLSYRKKDRKYIHRLIELIHSNEKYREVGVWYDEFLIPGETFDKQIENVLSKSDLFMLMVTSNLLEEKNYIIEEEYPKAVEFNRPILPIECAKTDKNNFHNVFPEIGEVYSVDDVAQIYDVLDNVFKDKNVDPKMDSSKRMHLIGMAYLEGVNVEKNGEKAIEYLSAAADMGCEEAYERLTQIYHNGDGIKADPEKEIIWQRKFVELLEKEQFDEEAKLKLMKAKLELARCILGRARFDEAKAVYKEVFALVEELKGAKDVDMASYEYQINSELGDSIRLKSSELKRKLSIAEVEEAKGYYLCALEKCTEDPLRQIIEYTNLAGLVYQIAEFMILEKKDKNGAKPLLEEASEYCKKAVEAQNKLAENAHSYEVLRIKSVLLDKIAGIYRIEENYSDTLNYFADSLKIWEKFKKDYPSKYHEEGYALACYNYAETLYHLGQIADAEELLIKTAKSVGILKDKGGMTGVGVMTGYKTNYLLATIYKTCHDEKKFKYYANASKKYELWMEANIRR